MLLTTPPGTLIVTLVTPCAYFLDLCAFTTFYPVKVELADAEGIWATNPETYIGTGPFVMTTYTVDDVISFVKNPNYWNAANVKLGGINCYLSEDNVAILTAYENGTVQFIKSIDPTEFARLKHLPRRAGLRADLRHLVCAVQRAQGSVAGQQAADRAGDVQSPFRARPDDQPP